MKTYNNIVLNIPHGGMFGLDNSGWELNEQFWAQVERWTDWGTPHMFCAPGTRKAVFPYSRFVVDVERLENDPLESVGQGILYTRFNGHERTLSPENRERLMTIYKAYMARLAKELTPGCLLIDCHSFPQDLSSVDVCIGYNNDWSKPSQEVIDLISSTYSNAGYKVGINTPYSNSITPARPFPYSSVMIELNKRIYWDEEHHRLTSNAASVCQLFDSLCAQLQGK